MYKYLKGGGQKDGSHLCLVVPSNSTRDNRDKLMVRKFHLNVRKKFFTGAGDQALEHVIQEGFGVSFMGNVQKPSGCKPVQCPLE